MSDYVADIPPVLFVRVTPKMVEASGRKWRGAPHPYREWPCQRSSG